MTRKAGAWSALLVAALFSGCGAQVDEPKVGGETHFLSDCEDSCDEGLSCIGGVCTRECDDVDDCADLSGEPQCTDAAGLGSEVCDAACDSAADCEALGSDYECAAGFCRGSTEPPSDPAPSGCTVGDVTYEFGESFECADGCNTCFCSEDGIESTLIDCAPGPDPNPPAITCEDGGNTYALGESWICSDGCNTCVCSEEGVGSTDIACPSEPEPSLPLMTCEDGGNTYVLGDTWPCSDGCNMCECTELGTLSTAAGCPEPSLPLMTCEYEGNTYMLGDTWPCSDGCNICGCIEEGVYSTDAACMPCMLDGEPYAVGATVPSDCNTCTCQADGNFICTEIACEPGEGCDVDGVHYAVGDDVPSGDCNACGCAEDGIIVCTEIVCEPGEGCDVDGVHYAVGDAVPAGDSCNTCGCQEDGSILCTTAECPEVLEFSDWTTCEDEACLCEALAACSNVAYQEALPLGSYNARICSRTAESCRVAYFSETEGGGTGYDCNVPAGVDLCTEGFDRGALQTYCEPLYECNLLGAGPECPEPASCEASTAP